MFTIPREIINRHKDNKPSYNRVYWILRDCLIDGNINIGEEKLTEEKIAEALNVSRTPVRTAMAQLKNDGFLQNISKGRVGLNEFSIEDKKNLVESSIVLESAAASYAAHRATDEDIEALKEINNAIRHFHSGNRDDRNAFSGIRDLHASFHLMIAKISGNRFLYKYIVENRNIMRMLYVEHSVTEDTYPHIIAPKHDQLIEAISQKDSEAAKIIISSEILNTRKLYMRGYSE